MDDTTNQSVISDLDILEDLKMIFYDAIKKNDPIPKVGDLLKIIEMKNKLTVSGKAEKKFWEMIDKVRLEKLSSNNPSKSKKKIRDKDKSAETNDRGDK
jgi:hypothetical protein